MAIDDPLAEPPSDAVQSDPDEYLPAGEVLQGLELLPLPEGTTPNAALAFVRLDEPDGGTGWSVRVTEGTSDEEILGLLVGYTERLKQAAADAWDDTDPT
ncbi:hypothetical protein ACFQ8E_15065 [Isoptericola sp. NPDC056573]|uniref:hypothetical protein n=1 Tax=Isoptericola sp. NPDC056573 TaxID=3345868 RepID=UPI0036989BCE